MNLNELAKEIATAEGKKVEVNIAQIKEILGVLGKRWRDMNIDDFYDEAHLIRNKAGMR